MDANDQLQTPEDYARLIIAYKGGNPLRLGDVAEVVEAPENARTAAWSDAQAAVLLNIQRQPGANVIETVERVRKLLPLIRASLPESVDLAIVSDRTDTIRASVRDVQFELMLAVALVVAVIFLFLRNLAATAVPAVVVPLSLVGTFGFMHLAGFSINNLTLMALTIASGFVVDDAIVMIENIARHLREHPNRHPVQAALDHAGGVNPDFSFGLAHAHAHVVCALAQGGRGRARPQPDRLAHALDHRLRAPLALGAG